MATTFDEMGNVIGTTDEVFERQAGHYEYDELGNVIGWTTDAPKPTPAAGQGGPHAYIGDDPYSAVNLTISNLSDLVHDVGSNASNVANSAGKTVSTVAQLATNTPLLLLVAGIFLMRELDRD